MVFSYPPPPPPPPNWDEVFEYFGIPLEDDDPFPLIFTSKSTMSVHTTRISLRKQPTFREVATWALANDVWVTSAEIPYWWRALARSWYCFWLIERKFPRGTTNQKRYQDLGSARHEYGISALVAQTSCCEGSSGDLVPKLRYYQIRQNSHTHR